MKRILLIVLIFACVPVMFAQKQYTAYMVSNAHFDTQWNWDVQTSISNYLPKTMIQNFYLFEHYPDYVFNFEGGIKYLWMKEYYPKEYEKVKEYIKSGRWNICGSTWDATDPNIPSSESFFRNILYGQHYYRDEFGVYTSNDIFLPDCFGFGYHLPTIAAHAGLKGFSTQKLQWRSKPFYGDSKVPFKIGLWQGLDGSKIMAALDAQSYVSRFDEDLSYDEDIIKLAQGGVNNIAYRYYGTGDTGGSPTILSTNSIERGLKGNGPLKIINATAGQMYEDYWPFDKHPELPVFNGELLMDVHATGCYTSQAAMKRFNRRNERLADAAERASVVADWLGGAEYPAEEIRNSWRSFIWHQFHDDLTGTSLPKAYSFSWNDELIAQSKFADVTSSAVGAVTRALDTKVTGSAVVVYNSVAQPRKDIVVAAVPMSQQPQGITVTGPDGKSVSAQLLSYENGKATVLFAANVAPVSFSVYDVKAGNSGTNKKLVASGNTIENPVYKLTLDKNGDIASIIDKRSKKELVQSGKAFRLALFTENESVAWPAWEILKKTMDATPVSISGNVNISVAETGPARATLKVEKTYGDSKFVQYISLTDGAMDDRIDIQNEIDWTETNALLKAEFPMSISNPNAKYDLGIGYIERGNNTETAYEVIAQQWADLTSADGKYGIAIMNDCKYGWDKPADNTLRLTLLHTPKTGNRYEYQSKQDWGPHTFSYSIVGHNGSAIDAGVAWKADALNNPLMSFNAPKSQGTLGRSFSFVKTSNPQVSIKAIKEAEKGEYYVVRVNEIYGKPYTNTEITFAAPIEAAQELNGVEDMLGDVKFSGNKIIISGTAFQPKTFAVKLKKNNSLSTPASMFVDLAYNASAVTPDAFSKSGAFDMRGNTFAAELMPESVISDGIRFKMNNKVDENNYVRCDGQTVVLPANHGCTKLYLMVTSPFGDRKTVFKVDGEEYAVNVPFWTDFYGQWGLKEFSEGFVKDGSIAYLGTHRHGREGNDPHVFTYIYKICLDIDKDARTLLLPKDRTIAVFAATLADNPNGDTQPAMEMRALPYETKEITYSDEVPQFRFRR